MVEFVDNLWSSVQRWVRWKTLYKSWGGYLHPGYCSWSRHSWYTLRWGYSIYLHRSIAVWLWGSWMIWSYVHLIGWGSLPYGYNINFCPDSSMYRFQFWRLFCYSRRKYYVQQSLWYILGRSLCTGVRGYNILIYHTCILGDWGCIYRGQI